MQGQGNVSRENENIDLTKFVCLILIIGSHSLPIFASKYANYFYGQWFFRFCVPVYFIFAGIFLKSFGVKK